MCGIVGYLGPREAVPVVLKGLKRLEYRGYDSAGISVIEGEELRCHKKQGKVSELEKEISSNKFTTGIGIGHTRWATHGEPTDTNAHPHVSSDGRFTLVHNGVIENYQELKVKLQKIGHQFNSQTDTEVLVNWIAHIQVVNRGKNIISFRRE